jgi:hypothetical protein
MSSRRMSLLPRATLHSDSEQQYMNICLPVCMSDTVEHVAVQYMYMHIFLYACQAWWSM